MSRPSKLRNAVSTIVLAGLVVAGVLLWNNREAVADDIRLFNYTPSAGVAALSEKIGFTGTGQRYFYASHPLIEDKSSFNAACGNTEAHATVLGCYTKHSIFVYNVTDSRLEGVQEVTAAHETLHAAYDRLSDGEHASVDAMLQRQYDSLAGDAAFADRFAVYNSLSQADRLNELHSIFGTEVASLSPELETYYAKYFKNRSVITQYYATYQGQFDALKAQQASLKSRINALETSIQAAETSYTSDRNALDADIQAFNQRANGGAYTSQAAFNQDRGALAARAQALNTAAASINANIDDYNASIKKYNELSVQTQDLQNSLDSNAVPAAPSV